MPSVPIGRRNCHITIQYPVTTNGVRSWVTFATAWAAMDPTQGVENASANMGPPNEQFTDVTIPYQVGVRPRMRILFKGRTLEITGVINVNEENEELKLTCREAVS